MQRIPVYDADGTALTPSTPAKVRKLISDGAAQRLFVDGRFVGVRLTRLLGTGRPTDPPGASRQPPELTDSTDAI